MITQNKIDPVYKKDILEQLCHTNGCPAILKIIETNISALVQHLTRAADEIETLREENKILKIKLHAKRKRNKQKEK